MTGLWPDGLLEPAELARQWRFIRPAFLALMRAHRLPAAQAAALAAIYLPLAAWIQGRLAGAQTRVLGVNGAQGSGKSTLSSFLSLLLNDLHGLRVVSLSIDDLYLSRAERERLGQTVHPLLRTRGVPGTHDAELSLALLQRLKAAGPATTTALPAFDKAQDDRRPREHWPIVQGRPDLILFEGWCVGSTPQAEADLVAPVNALERDEDPDGRWRRHVNEQLKDRYAQLFAELDALVFLQVPGMASVYAWRGLQEQKLAAATPGTAHRLLDTAALHRFIMHYERLTRHNLEVLPGRADLTLHLNEQHGVSGVSGKTEG